MWERLVKHGKIYNMETARKVGWTSDGTNYSHLYVTPKGNFFGVEGNAERGSYKTTWFQFEETPGDWQRPSKTVYFTVEEQRIKASKWAEGKIGTDELIAEFADLLEDA